MRTLFSILFVVIGFTSSPIIAYAADNQPASAISISIGGIGPGVDSRALARVNQLIADGIKQDLFDRFIIFGRGHEGGYSGCVQINPRAADKKVLLLEKRLLAIQPNPNTTAYAVELISVCQQQGNEIENP